MKTKNPLKQQMAAAYGETNTFGRVLVVGLLIVVLAALFVFRAATSDPLWAEEKAAAQQQISK